jgi:methyl-accepting chemotaxis protein
MAEMLCSMEEINASSDNIGKIIKVNEDIAFQRTFWRSTRRWSGQSRAVWQGFAVVAEEVKNLAGQSSKQRRRQQN